MVACTPGRGDLVWVDFTPQLGHEHAGRRPALVLSPREYNERVGLAVMCPVTRQIKAYPFEVRLPTGLAVEGAVLSDQVKSLDWRQRHAELICEVPAETVSEVLRKLRTLLH
jgi:mRNA interferase MazF